MTRHVTVHLHHDPENHWLSVMVGSSPATTLDPWIPMDHRSTHVAIVDTRTEPQFVPLAVTAARSLADTLDCRLVDKDGEPWTPDTLDTLTKELAS